MEATNELQQGITSPKTRALRVTFLVWVLLIDLLFYSENWGLNALIACGISIPVISFTAETSIRSIKWWGATAIWILTAIGVFVNGTMICTNSYMLAFFFFAAVSNNLKLSLPLGLVQSVNAILQGVMNLFMSLGNLMNKSGNKKNKWVINILIVTIPLCIVLLFLKLYQAADESFYELTKFLNLDWISWNFLLIYLFLTLFLYGFFHFNTHKDVDQLEEDLSNEIPTTYADKIQDFFGIHNEAKVAISILIALNALLLLYNALDIRFVFVDINDPTRLSSLSDIVHQGVYALIASIVMVILIVTYLLRGQLNFRDNKYIKPLILFWLFQNLLMILTTSMKNYEYIEFWGLTYKRIGVFVYLFLAFVGLVLTVIKVQRKKSIWYLFRTTTFVFAVCLTALLTFNWNRFIASYNLTHVQAERIDFYYLKDLGAETYPYIIDYHTHVQAVDEGIIIDIAESIPNALIDLKEQQENTSWRSIVWSDYRLEKELSAIQITYK